MQKNSSLFLTCWDVNFFFFFETCHSSGDLFMQLIFAANSLRVSLVNFSGVVITLEPSLLFAENSVIYHSFFFFFFFSAPLYFLYSWNGNGFINIKIGSESWLAIEKNKIIFQKAEMQASERIINTIWTRFRVTRCSKCHVRMKRVMK